MRVKKQMSDDRRKISHVVYHKVDEFLGQMSKLVSTTNTLPQVQIHNIPSLEV